MAFEQEILQAIRGKYPNRFGWVRGNCPICEDRSGRSDHKWSLGVNLGTGKYHCFKCGAYGRLHTLEIDEEVLARTANAPTVIEPPEHFYELASEEGQASCFDPAWEYLERRHITWEQVKALRIGACARGACAGRVVVPIFDAKGTWLWWVARAWIPKADNPYKYPSGPRGGLFFNEAALYVETEEPVIVVEGCFDAFPHLPDAVAGLGKPNPLHLEKLRDAKRPVVFGLDGDAWEEALGYCWKLGLHGVPTGAIRLPPKTDPHVTDRGLFRDAARRAVGQTFSVDLR